MNPKAAFCTVALLFYNAHAQEISPLDSAHAFERLIESAFDGVNEDDQSEVVEDLFQRQENPVNINEADERTLQTIPGISPITAYRITAARRSQSFTRVEDLLGIDGITPELLASILPFIEVARVKNTPKSFSLHLRSRLHSDIQKRRGYREGIYQGSRERLYQRIETKSRIMSSMDLEGAMIMEKDPGEKAADGFLGGHLRLSEPSAWQFILGHFVVESGSGLVLGRRSRIGRGQLSVTRERSERIIGYKSVNEQDFFRGVALETRLSGVTVMAFYSQKPVDGTVQPDSTLSGFPGTGLFRTLLERGKRNVSSERVAGGIVAVDLSRDLRFSVKAYHAGILHRLVQSASGSTRGPSLVSAGMSASFTNRTMNLWGEAALEENRSHAAAAGLEFDLGNYGSMMMTAGTFDKGFMRLFGNKRTPIREDEFHVTGILKGSSWLSLQVHWFLIGYSEGKTGGGMSVEDHGASVQAILKMSREVRLDVRYKTNEFAESGEGIDPLGRESSRDATRRTRTVFFNVTYGYKRSFRWISRIGYVRVEPPTGVPESGLLISQDLRYLPMPGLMIQVKATLFGTDSFYSRLYTFEPDVPGTVVNRAVFGKGSRLVAHTRIDLFQGVGASATYSVETKDGEEKIGSGLEEVIGDTNSRFTVQVDVRL